MPRWLGRVVATGCVLGVLVAAAVWWLAPRPGRTITAYVRSAVAVYPDNPVLVLGVPVGRITTVAPQGRQVKVVMRIDDSVTVPAGASAVVVEPSLVAGRSVQLTPAYTGGPAMPDGGVIPVERTAVPLGIDDLSRAANDLAATLGPTGANRNGALSDVLDVGAANLQGNGQAINDTIGNVTALSETLAGSRKQLFATVTQLQSFVSTLAANDAQVRQFTTQLADVSNFLAGERGDLGAALRELSIALGEVAAFVQDNHSLSRIKGTIRGLHFQTQPFAQDKLVRVIRGSILDVAVDIRQGSPTYGRHVAVRLTADDPTQILVPVGFAHGFCTLEPDTEVVYKVSNVYSQPNDRSLRWNDPALGIRWPVSDGAALLSDKDAKAPLLAELAPAFSHG